ncbi:MAG TPA: hypothetical protein VGK53_23525 [Propionicimonas sp.]
MNAGVTVPSERTPLRETALPGWRRWVFPAALIWALGYGAFRISSSLAGATAPPGSRPDLLAFPGWWSVALCGAAALVVLGLRNAGWSRLWAIAGWLVASSLVAASALLLLDVVAIILPGMGVNVDLAAFASRAACLACGLLVGATTVSYQRHWRGACPACGRMSQEWAPTLGATPWWARVAAGAAIAGWLARLLAQLAVGVGDELLRGNASVVLFETGFMLAGTVLPLALVSRWGRIVPAWLPVLAGRRVPRWLVLAPGLALGVGMSTYFGFTLVMIAGQTLAGTWQDSGGPLPLWFFWIAVPAYLVWGLGLGVAALAYRYSTHPRCRLCLRT